MRGPCAKRMVTCVLIPAGPRLPAFYIIGDNDCENAQQVCPRTEGEGYDKCRSICGQVGHAEMVALQKAKAAGVDLNGATAVVTGHHWICEPCGRALMEARVKTVRIEHPRT